MNQFFLILGDGRTCPSKMIRVQGAGFDLDIEEQNLQIGKCVSAGAFPPNFD